MIAAILTDHSYKVLDYQGKIVTNVDVRYAIGLVDRGLVKGLVHEKKDNKGKIVTELQALHVPRGISNSQIKNVMRLKPVRVSICNAATVVKVLPTTYTHRSSLMAGY